MRKPNRRRIFCFLESGREDLRRKIRIIIANIEAMIMMEMVNIFILIKSLKVIWILLQVAFMTEEEVLYGGLGTLT